MRAARKVILGSHYEFQKLPTVELVTTKVALIFFYFLKYVHLVSPQNFRSPACELETKLPGKNRTRQADSCVSCHLQQNGLRLQQNFSLENAYQKYDNAVTLEDAVCPDNKT